MENTILPTSLSNPGTGYYYPSISATGCTASITGQSVKITAMSADSAQVAITLNCEGKQTFTKIMSLTKSKNGTNGTNGADGAYFERRYQVTSSTTQWTGYPNKPTGSNPSGWSTLMPNVGVLQYLWEIESKKAADGTLLQEWSTPIRINGIDGANGAVGATGEKGDVGPSIVYRGKYSNTAIYYGTSKRVDVVLYTDGKYYIAQITAGDGFSGSTYPPTNTTKWNKFSDNFESVATGLLLAELAYIENLIVGRLSTGKDDSLPRLLAGGSDISLYDKKADEGNASRALVRIGKDVGIVQTLGGSRPGINIKDVNGDGKTSELTSAGLFTDGSNVRGQNITKYNTDFGTIFTIDSAMSIVGLLKSRMSGLGTSISKNAAVFGFDKTSDGSYSLSEGYGGWFNKLKADGLYIGYRYEISAPTATTWLSIGDTDVYIVFDNTSNTLGLLLGDQYSGRTIYLRRIGSGQAVVRGYDNTTPIFTNQAIGTNNLALNVGETYLLVYVKGITQSGNSGQKGTWFANKIGI